MTNPIPRGHLPRLSIESYQGLAFVHWVMSVDNRAVGWLTPLFHVQFREAMIHTLVRHSLMCPTYCLMPDHIHLLWLGCASASDQRIAATLFRGTINPLLAPEKLQREAYDHVLTAAERQSNAFQSVSHYILENPVRKNLVTTWEDYEYSGAVIPGFADLPIRRSDYWDVFWKVYNRQVVESAP